ncbi:MAG: 6-phosphofructokinase [Crocinitomicaceae bacterium]|nr:6-phosphofructokinase [Crocinitomicaceae bacterium]
MKRIAFLTSGGDSPGMNACIRAIVKNCLHQDIQPVGIRDGFNGIMHGDFWEMTYDDVNNIIQSGGTILGTARSEDFKDAEKRKKGLTYLLKNKIDALIVIGGDGSFAGANAISNEIGIPVIGVPATIDNDIYGTDQTVGFDTALNTVVEAVDKIRDTASSHKRIFFVEVMGRDSGYLALKSAVASGAEMVLIPEEETNIEKLAIQLKNQNQGKRGSIVIVAEGDDAGGSMDIIGKVKPHMEDFDLRATVLGHIQRGGRPSAYDRILATTMGAEAVDILIAGKKNVMVGHVAGKIKYVDLIQGIKLHALPDKGKLDLLDKLRTKNSSK